MLKIENQGTDSPLRQAVLEIAGDVEAGGWDQPARLFSLINAVEIMATNPHLIDDLPDEEFYIPVEQEIPLEGQIEEFLAGICWPTAVEGCVLVMERLTLPPEAEAALPDDPAEAAAYVSQHPDRSEMRIIAGVLRDRSEHAAVRARVPEEAPLLEGPGLLPGLIQLLHSTFSDWYE